MLVCNYDRLSDFIWWYAPYLDMHEHANKHRFSAACSHLGGARCSSVVRAFAHGAMGRRIVPSWGGPIELFLFPASAPRLV